MYNDGQPAQRFYAVSYDDDQPDIVAGSLIPNAKFTFTPKRVALPPRTPRLQLSTRVVTALATLLFIIAASFGSAAYVQVYGIDQLASLSLNRSTDPVPVVVAHPYTNEQVPLTYGVQVMFAEPNFFVTTRDAFIDASQTFIEADLAAMRVRYFVKGVLTSEYPIINKGATGTFWETPAGLYAVEKKKDKHFASYGQVYLPHSLSFQGNFYIHGSPYFETGEMASSSQHGGIELATADAADLYSQVALNTPVLVYEVPTTREPFLYEPKVPDLATPHYLIADVESSTVLASSDLDMAVPIASLTKLMTAVVAVEYINLDTRIATVEPTFVQSLVPRLSDRSSVSIYSLLELLLLESSNEAAEVIAGEVGREQFVAHMNARAKALGMEHTHFADPSGLSAENVSSVSDLLRLIQYIYDKRRFIVDISAGKKLPDIYVTGEFDNVANFNDVAGLSNFIGGKIGETTAAGQTSVTLHTLKVKGTERVVAIIILGSAGRTADVQALMEYAEVRFGS